MYFLITSDKRTKTVRVLVQTRQDWKPTAMLELCDSVPTHICMLIQSQQESWIYHVSMLTFAIQDYIQNTAEADGNFVCFESF